MTEIDTARQPEQVAVGSGSLLAFLKGTVAEVDESVAANGFPYAVKEAFERVGIHITPVLGEDTSRSLEEDPVLLVATHPHLLNDTFGIIGAVPHQRDDVSVVSDALHTGLGENISKHLIPIYGVTQQPTKNFRERLRRTFLVDTPHPNRLYAARANKESLRDATGKINNGGIVAIFPEGSHEKGGDWYNGVGDILQNIRNPDAKVIFAKTEGEEWRNRARAFSSKSRKLLGDTQLKVVFSGPFPIEKFGADSRAEITKELRSQYELFAEDKT